MWLDKLVIAAVSPLGTALCLGLLAAVVGHGEWRDRAARWRWAWRLGALALGWLTLWSLPVASHGLRTWLEAPYPAVPVDRLPTAQAIVVLGGGLTPPGRDGSHANLNEAADRLWHAARLYHAGRAPLVLLSGGSNALQHRTSEARAMQAVLAELGVPMHAMRLEEHSRNTRENAKGSAEELLSGGRSQILLVTSALHMPRARSLFEAQGLRVTPAATDHTPPAPPGPLAWVPDTAALDGSTRALKELLGRWSGR